MAQKTNPRLYREIFLVFGILSVVLLAQKGDAYDFKVGDSTGWTVPKDPNATFYNQWAEKNRFQIGDTLLFVYAAGQDSVLHVTQDEYTNCSTETALEKFTDGHTVFKFNQSGPHYFISGVADNCRKNEKLVVVVMADRRSSHGPNGTVSTPPSSSPPSPAPAGEESPSPPPSGEPQTNPTPAPSQESRPPRNSGYMNGASVVTAVVAAFFGSSLVFGI
ncbi:early nodulin-like protein 9 [Striga hermonthica]|uniref:Early nodulin-like protein 9 n=1 Tax=Striga hermonthica TaxID=68872 RepID=A0A9N7MKV6_STRHE|nr:early nodulin-like protein 9 [Striga hermonthica]